jgi:hypothetical protein
MENGKSVYYNSVTETFSRRVPKGTRIVRLPEPWKKYISKSNNYPYFFNLKTGVTSWTLPDGVEDLGPIVPRVAKRFKKSSLKRTPKTNRVRINDTVSYKNVSTHYPLGRRNLQSQETGRFINEALSSDAEPMISSSSSSTQKRRIRRFKETENNDYPEPSMPRNNEDAVLSKKYRDEFMQSQGLEYGRKTKTRLYF